MRGKEQKIALAISAVLIVFGLLTSLIKYNIYQFPEVPKPVNEETTDLSNKKITVSDDFVPRVSVAGRTNYADKTIVVGETFTSNLPLVVIDTGEQVPRRGVVWDKELECNVPTGEDPYAYGTISIINNSNGTNRPADCAETYSLCKVKVRGNSSGNYDKEQYLIKLIDEEGKSEKHNVLSMGKDSEWILNVSFIDKSLLRNYLAYMTAGAIMPNTPDVQFCEVLWKNAEGYRYEGVYMMMESVSVSENRVDLPQYAENSAVTPALLRRDRYNVTGIILDNYATQNGLTYGYLEIKYPEKDVISQKGIENVTDQINRFEKALYADVWEQFIKYRDYVDMRSFIDYFILNEYFLNYDAGYNSTYTYMDYSGKLIMGPVWDFDQAIDNDAQITAKLDSTAFHSAPWFNQILKDPVVTAAIIERYQELRKSILSDESIQSFVEKTIEYLGPAIQRDWARWGYYYENANYLQNNSERNTHSYQQEIDRILYVLSTHGRWMDENLDTLYQFKMISLEDAESKQADAATDYRPALAIVFIAVFLISVKLVLKSESE